MADAAVLLSFAVPVQFRGRVLTNWYWNSAAQTWESVPPQLTPDGRAIAWVNRTGIDILVARR